MLQIKKEDDVKTTLDVVNPSVAIIHATATIDSSPFQQFAQEEWESIFRFVRHKDHLQKNVINMKFVRLTSRLSDLTGFKHVVELQLFVKTDALWETPRSYLWKHVGQDSWSRSNGSVITLARIHQKN